MVLLGRLAALHLSVAIGYVYPVYASAQALRVRNKPELQQWITFWTVNALFSMLELIGDTIVAWLPFYFEAKLAFLLWLVLPTYNGARILHAQYLAPTFVQHEHAIDSTLLSLKRKASDTVMQACKDAAMLALQRSSGVVAQSQQFVVAQLVQQAFGRNALPATATDAASATELRAPSFFSLFAKTTTATNVVDSKDKANVAIVTQECVRVKVEVADCPVKTTNESTGNSNKQQRAAKATAVVSTTSTTTTTTTTARQEKSRELVQHFKKLLVKGFQLQYFAAAGIIKHRTFRLPHADARYVVFESASSSASSTSSGKKKAVKLLLRNIRRVSATVDSDDASSSNVNELLDDLDLSLAFCVDNGKAALVFQAESQKTRDLLVAGLRLLVTEHKRVDGAALATLEAARRQQLLACAFEQLASAVHSTHDASRK